MGNPRRHPRSLPQPRLRHHLLAPTPQPLTLLGPLRPRSDLDRIHRPLTCGDDRSDLRSCALNPGDGDWLQSLPALPPRRATSCRALVDHVPDHPAHREEQPAQPRKAPALATAPRTPGGERAHRQPDRRRQAKRPNARNTHPSTLPSAGGGGAARNIRVNPARPSSGPPAPLDLRTNLA